MADIAAHVSGVAERYAAAFLDLANEQGALAQTEADVNRIAALIEESADLRRLIASPVFSAREQERAMSAVLAQAGIGGIAANLVRVMAANRRLFVLPGTIAAFRVLLARQRGEVAADVVSAEPLTDRHIADLKAALKSSLGKDVTLNTSVDKTLIGGLIVKVGSRMIDDSLKTKLATLRIVMKEVR